MTMHALRHLILLVIFVSLFGCKQREPGIRNHVSHEEEVCNFQDIPCVKELKEAEFRLDIEPKPLQAFRETEFILTITPKNSRFKVQDSRLEFQDSRFRDELLLDLSMQGMFMGKNQVVLKRTEGNNYKNSRFKVQDSRSKIQSLKFKGKGIIPRCPSGKTLWQADIYLPDQEMVSFRFHVK
jgi:hypothetical protein